jgi:hypothetical protein
MDDTHKSVTGVRLIGQHKVVPPHALLQLRLGWFQGHWQDCGSLAGVIGHEIRLFKPCDNKIPTAPGNLALKIRCPIDDLRPEAGAFQSLFEWDTSESGGHVGSSVFIDEDRFLIAAGWALEARCAGCPQELIATGKQVSGTRCGAE